MTLTSLRNPPTRNRYIDLFTSVLALLTALNGVVQGQTQSKKGILLEDLTWMEAEKVLNSNTVVVIPLGAESKEHGPHLKLKNDWLMAEYLKQRVLAEAKVVVAPTINYNYYPAFLEYPRLDVAQSSNSA